jgi:hypothetical protein
MVNNKQQGDNIILVKLFIGDLVLDESIKSWFWEELKMLVCSVPIPKKLFDEVWCHGYLTERTLIAGKGPHYNSVHLMNKSRSQGTRPRGQ